MAKENNESQPQCAINFQQVTDKESGQKLLQFLQRKLDLPPSLLHRWVRTGQIRINGRRSKPFSRIATGDTVRIPPFAHELAGQTGEPDGQEAQMSIPEIIGRHKDIIAVNKPSGLAAQPGTGHAVCVCSLLAPLYHDAPFKPVPCHRLDRDTSGVMLVAESFAGLRSIQESMKENRIHKEYLAWVEGKWPHKGPALLKHFLRKEKCGDKTLVRAYDAEMPHAREARCIVQPLATNKDATLLQVRLLTGRTHQIRAQLAHCGFSVIGDVKYGKSSNGLLLHAFRVILPDGPEFVCTPAWTAPYDITRLPKAIGMAAADLDSLPSIP